MYITPDMFRTVPLPTYKEIRIALVAKRRVAVDKNIEAFLDLDPPGTKMVVGDGPRPDFLKKKCPSAGFPSSLLGEE